MTSDEKRLCSDLANKYEEFLDFVTKNEKLLEDFREKNKKLIKNVKSMRNCISHSCLENEYPFMVNPKVYDQLLQLIDLAKKEVERLNKKLISEAIRKIDIVTTTLDDKLLPLLTLMKEKNFSYIPVLNDKDIVVGVLTENTILSYITKNEGILIDNNTMVREVEEFISIDENRNEKFLFVSRDTKMIDINKLFNDAFKDRKRLAVIYITQNGSPTEKLLGMVTAWDILGKDN